MAEETGYVDMLKDGEKKLQDILQYLGPDNDVDKEEYESFVKALAGVTEFPGGKEQIVKIDKAVRAVLNIGLKDGEQADEQIPVSQAEIPVGGLQPTQAQIGLLDSIGYIAFVLNEEKQFPTIESYKSGKPNIGGKRIITANGKYILDGHHRWSGVFMINPDAQIQSWDLKMDSNDPEKMLSTIQLAIAASYRALLMKNANAKSDIFNYGGSVRDLVERVFRGEFGFSGGKFENCATFIQIMAGVKPEELDLSAKGKSDAEVLEIVNSLMEKYPQVIDTLAKNAELVKSKKPKAGAPLRVAMPQPEDTAKMTGNTPGDLPAAVASKLKSGELNFKDPLVVVSGQEAQVGENTKWIKTYEQFRNKK